MVGLLIVGGGIYAYESTMATRTPAKTVAMKTPVAPTSMAASTPSQPVAPDSNLAPPTATPEPPAKSAPVKSAPVKSASEMPAPKTEPLQQSASSAPGVGIGPTNDPAINAPMTFTADNAPPAQQPGSQTAQASQSAQTAMQQPITAPIVGNTSQPTAAVANNQTSGVSLPSGSTPTPPASAPAGQVTQQPAQPAQ